MQAEGTVAEWTLQMSKMMAELIAKLIGKGSMKLAAALLAALSDPAQHPGLIQLLDLEQRGDAVKIIKLTDEQYKKFSKSAKKYGIYYATARLENGVRNVMVGESQLPLLNQLLEDIGIGQLSKNAETPSQSSEELTIFSPSDPTQETTERGKIETVPVPAQPETAPAEPIPAPVQPETAPAEPIPASVQPETTPAEPIPAPVQPELADVPIEGALAEQPVVQRALEKLPDSDRGELSDLISHIDSLENQITSLQTQLNRMQLAQHAPSSPLHAIGRGIADTLHWGQDRLRGIKGVIVSVCKAIAEDTKVHSLGILSRMMDVIGVRKGLGAVADAVARATERVDRLQTMAAEAAQPAERTASEPEQNAPQEAPLAPTTPAPESEQAVPPVQQPTSPEAFTPEASTRQSAPAAKPSVVAKVEKIAQRQQSEAHQKATPTPIKKNDGMER